MLRAIIIKFRTIFELLDLSRSLRNLGNLRVLSKLEVIEDSNKSRSRFNLDDVKFFNIFYENKYASHRGGLGRVLT